MRTLAVILASSAEFYTCIPALRALQRKNPDGEIHILLRETQDFPEELISGFHLHPLRYAEILEPIFSRGDEALAHVRLQDQLESLRQMGFASVHNFSFTALSSYVTDYLAGDQTQVTGFTRHADGTLRIPDDVSAYIHAQTGVRFPNRYPLSQLFATQAGCELNFEDLFAMTAGDVSRVVVNLESSTSVYPPELWARFLKSLREHFAGAVLVTVAERHLKMAQTVSADLEDIEIHVLENLGNSAWVALSDAAVLVSAPHAMTVLASLRSIPVLFLSDERVNFWECGPWAIGSRVVMQNEIQNLSPQTLVQHTLGILSGAPPSLPCFLKDKGDSPFATFQTPDSTFAWELIQALYTSASYPQIEEQATDLAFQRLFELSELAMQTLASWDTQTAAAVRTLQAIDDMLIQLPELCPAVAPVVRWFQVERLRLGPSSEEDVLKATKKLFSDLFLIASVYRQYESHAQTQQEAKDLCLVCASSFREFEFQPVVGEFQKLLSHFHELARHSTKVGERDWSEVLSHLTESFDRQDYIEVADQLEHVLPELLAP